MTYQKVTGTISSGAHPGSYNGQDAYNDMLVTDENNNHQPQLYAHGRNNQRNCECALRNGQQRPAYRDCNTRGGGDGKTVNEKEPTCMSNRKGHNGVTEDGTATTLTAQEKERPLIGTSIVRRLTPVECERLQNFPDDWSKYGVDENGKEYELSDSARYRLQGNSIARPFWTWLLRRIAAQYERKPTLGSLFAGQGGFELCALETGIKPIWSSEIEKHAVAVLKYHFGDDEYGIEGDWREYV